MEQKTLNTTTIITYSEDGSVSIVCNYNDEGEENLPNIIFADIAETNITFNGKLIQQGDLFMFLKNYPFEINAKIDDRGHLLLMLNTQDSQNYFIDSDTGRLKYNK